MKKIDQKLNKLNVSHSGFTLVETIISMFLILLVCFLLISVLTKKIRTPDIVTTRGQFACWWEKTASGVNLYQWQTEERAPLTKEPVLVGKFSEIYNDETFDKVCRLQLNERPARFYVLAKGAGANISGKYYYGQVLTAFSDELGSNVGILPGVYNATDHEKGDTRIGPIVSNDAGEKYLSSTSIMEVKGYQATDNPSKKNIIASNITECKLTTANLPCPKWKDSDDEIWDASAKQESCTAVEGGTVIGDDFIHFPAIKINGCDFLNKDGSYSQSNLFKIADLISSNPDDSSSICPSSDGYTTGVCPENTGDIIGDVGFNLLYFDSSYRSDILIDKMSLILNSISTKRTSAAECIENKLKDEFCNTKYDLISKLLKATTEDNNKEFGAVLILW